MPQDFHVGIVYIPSCSSKDKSSQTLRARKGTHHKESGRKAFVWEEPDSKPMKFFLYIVLLTTLEEAWYGHSVTPLPPPPVVVNNYYCHSPAFIHSTYAMKPLNQR